MREHALSTHPAGPSRRASGPRPLAPGAALASAIGNRGMNALVARLGESTPTSPPAVGAPEEAAIEEGVELTTPGWLSDLAERFGFGAARGAAATTGAAAAAGAVAGAAAATPVPVQNPKSLTIKGSGPIAGKFGISKYWPVTRYWGADKWLGKFDKASTGGWRTLGHKFQVIGEFTTGTTTTGTGGNVTFKQEARITNTKGGTPGAWFDDMDYTDSGGGKHTWDPNAENGTTPRAGYPGVRRTISKTKYAYTDPPAISYQKRSTNDYRKLEFRISLIAPPGASSPTITKTATQEIEIVNGKPKVLQAP